jgi:hypothetical protein
MIDDDSPSWAADGGNDYTWTEKAYDLVVAGELAASAREDARTGVLTVVASGPCPRCGDHLDLTAQLSAVADTVTTLGDKKVTAERWVRFPVTCGCGRVHGQAPDGATGCNATFALELLVRPE